jgi:hypothetical protein
MAKSASGKVGPVTAKPCAEKSDKKHDETEAKTNTEEPFGPSATLQTSV